MFPISLALQVCVFSLGLRAGVWGCGGEGSSVSDVRCRIVQGESALVVRGVAEGLTSMRHKVAFNIFCASTVAECRIQA